MPAIKLQIAKLFRQYAILIQQDGETNKFKIGSYGKAARIIEQERPQGLLGTLGGQTGLNLATQLARAGVLDKFDVDLLGTSLEAIEKAEDRDRFRETMRSIGEPIPDSAIITTIDEGMEFVRTIVYPVIIRPAPHRGKLHPARVRPQLVDDLVHPGQEH